MQNLTLVIPAKHEKESLPKVLHELKKFELKKKVILEKSDKETIESIKDFDCEIIFQNNKGYGDALIHGINNIETDFFCIFNADGSFNPSEIDQMFKKINLSNSDFIFASRYEKLSGSDDDTIITFVGNYIFTYIGKIFFNLNITDILYTFVIGKTNKAKELNLSCRDFTFCVELPIKAKKANMNLTTIPSKERRRIAGKKKVSAFKDGFKILMYIIKLFFSGKNN